jgi:hypothetical protein
MRMTEAMDRRGRFLSRLAAESYPLTRETLDDLLYFGRTTLGRLCAGGAWNQDQFAILGVSWPPRGGWKRRVIRQGSIPTEAVRRFLALAPLGKKERKRIRRGDSSLFPDSP